MKALDFYKPALFAMLLSASVIPNSATAQSDKKPKSDGKEQKTSIRIKVLEDEDGKTKNIEKSYEVGAMSDQERDKFVEKVLDSLGVDKKKKQTISITVDDGDQDVIARKRRKVIIDHRDDNDALAYHWKNDISGDWDFNTEKFRRNMKDFEREFKPKAKVFMHDMENFGDRMGEIWDKEVMKPANVRSLNVYSNNPDNGMLNLRFAVPEKGDVTITVTDIKGKEVGKKEIKDFEGEFVGQIELKKNTKGTLFVTVVQNEDGTVKRVVVP
jgi:hypothetical protein